MGSAHAPGSEVINVEVPGGALEVEVISAGAEWSVGAGSAPAYPAEAVRRFRHGLDALVTVQPVACVDHPASIMSRAGARASAALIAAALTIATGS